MQGNLTLNPISGDLKCLTLQLTCSVAQFTVVEVELGPGACWVRTNGTGISTGHTNITRILIV